MNYKNEINEHLNDILDISSELKENEYIKIANTLKEINKIVDKMQNTNLTNDVEENEENYVDYEYNTNNSSRILIYYNGILRRTTYTGTELRNVAIYIPELDIYIHKNHLLNIDDVWNAISRDTNLTLENLYDINRRLLKNFNLIYGSRHTKKRIKEYLRFCNIRIRYFDSKRKREIIAELLNILANY